MRDLADNWNKCLHIISDNVNEAAFKTWFVPIVPLQFENNVLILQVPSQYFVEYIEENFIVLLQASIYRIFGKGTLLEYRVLVDKSNGRATHIPSTHALPESKITKQKETTRPTAPFLTKTELPEIDPQLNLAYNFNNLVEGGSNKLARTAGITIANDPGKTIFNPLFVYGQSGVGKTHLVNAIGVMTKQLHPEKRVLYVSANTFQIQYTDAVRTNTVNDFLNFYQTIDVLIIDDIHDFMGKTGTQNTFFHIFNHLHQSGKQLVLTSDRSPLVLAGMEQRLLTRFKWGLSAEIEKSDLQLRKDILKSKIYRDGLEISDQIVDFIAQNVVDNIRDLEGVLVSLMAHSTLIDTPIDLSLAEKVVGRVVNVTSNVITVETIRDAVCRYFDLSVDSISTKSRKREVVQARQIAMYISKQHTKNSLSSIGAVIGKRDHATVLHACKTVSEQIEMDKILRRAVLQIQSDLNI